MKHTFFNCADQPKPCAKTHCPWCDGGLLYCTVCLAAEGTLPSHCPMVPISTEDQDLIYSASMDYKDGRWTTPTSITGGEVHHVRGFEAACAILRLNCENLEKEIL